MFEKTKEQLFDEWLDNHEYIYARYLDTKIYIDGELSKDDLLFLLQCL